MTSCRIRRICFIPIDTLEITIQGVQAITCSRVPLGAARPPNSGIVAKWATRQAPDRQCNGKSAARGFHLNLVEYPVEIIDSTVKNMTGKLMEASRGALYQVIDSASRSRRPTASSLSLGDPSGLGGIGFFHHCRHFPPEPGILRYGLVRPLLLFGGIETAPPNRFRGIANAVVI